MQSNWQRVYTSDLQYRAEIVKAVLAEHNIHAVLIDKKDSAYHFGNIELYVAPEQVLTAIKIIEDGIDFG
jgi:type III secretory pathway lipoprotein EscJ